MPKKNDELEPVPSSEDAAKEKSSEVKTPAKPKAEKPKSIEEGEKPAKPSTTKPMVPAVSVGSENEAPVPGASKPGFLQNKRSLATRGAAVLVAVAAVVVLAFGVLVYVYKSEGQAVRVVSGIVPYPIQKVNGSFVSYNDYLFEVEANKRAYQNNAKLNNQPAVDFKSADGKKLVVQIEQHALDKLKNDAVAAQLAHQKKVTVSNKEVNDLVNELYKRYGGKETLLKTLNQIYGWNLNDLKKVVRKQLLAKKLQDKVTADPAVDAQAKAKAQDVLAKVKDNGDFAALAKQYSQASDASSGGDLGQFTKGQLPDEVQKAVDVLQPGGISDLVKTQYGYEIIKVTEKNGDSTRASHILIKTVDFDEYFQGQVDKAKVKTYIKV